MLALVALASALLAGGALAATGGAGVGPHAGRTHSFHGHTARANPFNGRGMWIWVVGASSRGNLASIVAQARRYGVATLFIKAGDGSSVWPQFNSTLVSALHANGVRACAWQYVYGNHPISEAYVGAAAVHAGADCLVIDAEAEYEGKYIAAQRYIQRLRALIGPAFPVALAGFPYVDYHRAFPYSVFLGPGGAQYNAPQMYWRDIGTTVDAVFAHTFVFNRIYQRPIFPLGQVYDSPPARQVRRFRMISRAYGSAGVSWWDWQEARPGAWRVISQTVGALPGFVPDADYATLGKGALGDLVVWAQEHLVSAGEAINIDGGFGPKTLSAVQAFQTTHRLPATGLIDTVTWQALLRYAPARVSWTIRHSRLTATTAGGRAILRVPKSASLPARAYEIPRSLGAGAPGP